MPQDILILAVKCHDAERSFRNASPALSGIGHMAWLVIVLALWEGSHSSNGLKQVKGLNQVNCSRHLAVLRHHGIVAVHRQG